MPPPGAYWPPALIGIYPTQLVETQTITWLREDPTLDALVDGRIYTAVPPGTPFPLVLLEAVAPQPWARAFRATSDQVTFQLKAQSQVMGDYEVNQISDRIRQVLDGARAEPLGPLRSARWKYDSGQPGVRTEELAGIVTYYRPVLMRVFLTV